MTRGEYYGMGAFVPRLKDVAKLKNLSEKSIERFREIIYTFYREHGRDYPWRRTSDPYRICISEIMLQQTQTERVVNKYRQFITAFPGFDALTEARLEHVLALWQGLGYNRRALALIKIARIVVDEFNGELPDDVEILQTFPGIGITTASEIATFAFGKPAVFIETNIRRVFIYFFFSGKVEVKDRDIFPLVEKTMDRSDPRNWYYALMDYGVMLKKAVPNPNRRSAHYTKQSPFQGSDRQIRGGILRILLARPHCTGVEISKELNARPDRVKKILKQLQREGFVQSSRGRFAITESRKTT